MSGYIEGISREQVTLFQIVLRIGSTKIIRLESSTLSSTP